MNVQHSLISVIIPVYNGEYFIADAIQSVLDQNYDPLEIIVVDDGSTDKTKKVVLQFGNKIIYHKKENGGVASARNKGLELAKGEFIAFIDADDVWTNDKLRLQLDILTTNQGSGIVIGFTQKSPLTLDVGQAKFDKKPHLMLIYSLGSSLIRKSVFKIVGVFNEEMLLSEDTDWFYRAMEVDIQIELHKDIVQYYRFHQNNITADKKRNLFYQIKAHKMSIDRRRKLGNGSVASFPKPNNLDAMIKYWKSVTKK